LSSETHHIAEQRRKAKQKRKDGEAAAKHHNYLCRLVWRSAKKDREAYISNLCEQIENCRKQNLSREVYEGVRKLASRFAPKIIVVKDEQRKILTAEKEIRDR